MKRKIIGPQKSVRAGLNCTVSNEESFHLEFLELVSVFKTAIKTQQKCRQVLKTCSLLTVQVQVLEYEVIPFLPLSLLLLVRCFSFIRYV